MQFKELQNWILSDDGLGSEIKTLSRLSAAKSIGITGLALEDDLKTFVPDWGRLTFAASILAKSDEPKSVDVALQIAHSGLICADSLNVRDACAMLLNQLSNQRAITLAESRGLIPHGVTSRVGVSEQLLATRRELAQSIFLADAPTIKANQFQRNFWDRLEDSSWVSASAPTASGKTFLVLQWMLKQFSTGRAYLGIFIAPTRALVTEIEREILDIAHDQDISNLRVSSLPLAQLGDRSRPTILVFTQERLHIFLNTQDPIPKIDLAIIDEVQKLGDGLRGVILQDAIERLARSNSQMRFTFLSPLTENPELLIADTPSGLVSAVVDSNLSTVSQNLFTVDQKPRKSECWRLNLQIGEVASPIGDFELHSRPDGVRKRLSFIALAIGRHQSGTLVYANGADEAEILAWQIYDGLEDKANPNPAVDAELKELSDFTKDIIHPDYQLVELLKRGVAFHYGNMPSLLRSEIERLFTEGKIRFLVCTSTLIEGVNLACHSIVVRGPRKGNNKPMGPHDFWNLAGRAGRWGRDFHGNIVCIDTSRADAWPTGTPKRTRYPIKRETEKVLGDQAAILEYVASRVGMAPVAIQPRLEQVLAYLSNWYMREGTIKASPSVSALPENYVTNLDDVISKIIATIEIPEGVALRHSGVSSIALQSLLNEFRTYKGPAENLLPADPASSDAYDQFTAIFDRINRALFPAFTGPIPLHALVTVEWMRGFPLGQIIKNRISYAKKHGRTDKLPKIIRDTMKEVEEYARFKVPKYLAAYLDVLKYHLHEIGQANLYPDNLKFDLYLEYGVATKTLLSLIGIGLSRTSAIAINEYLADNELDETEVVERLKTRRWETLSLPNIVKREITQTLGRVMVGN